MAEETNEISDKRPTGWGSLPFLIDLLEPVSHFVEAVRETLTSGNQMDSDIHKAVNFYCVPLQDFTPDTQIHDIIWIQWCIGHLTDEDFVSFFKRAIVNYALFELIVNMAWDDITEGEGDSSPFSFKNGSIYSIDRKGGEKLNSSLNSEF
ncbi:alpha N-terminal protein methyltransferase 1-like isoform X1 [Prosopis cineraria]|uniref:alpha N-terminal protein methyltransferase 1-like isoform X1 n=1 Tax=Prosopis cineraria TaxID=364024 RepID=UPI0024100E36|nr:alpha N-terminal protein methyltransferase 1-like isoform X1 [Prosopis cineraria]